MADPALEVLLATGDATYVSCILEDEMLNITQFTRGGLDEGIRREQSVYIPASDAENLAEAILKMAQLCEEDVISIAQLASYRNSAREAEIKALAVVGTGGSAPQSDFMLDTLRRLVSQYNIKHGMAAAMALISADGPVPKPLHELNDIEIEEAVLALLLLRKVARYG